MIKSSDSKYKAILSSRDFENSDTFTGFEKINLEMFNKDERKQYIDFYQCGEEEINKIEYKCKDIKTPFESK